MATPRPFHASILIPLNDHGHTVTDRIACRRRTRVLEEKPENARARLRRNQYRQNLLNVLTSACDRSNALAHEGAPVHLVQKFTALAETLEKSKAVGFLFENGECTEEGDKNTGNPEDDQDTDMMVPNDVPRSDRTSRAQTPKLLDPRNVHGRLLHPLSIALLAYQLGGPVNAAYTAHAHEWQLPRDPAKAQSFHLEGDTGNIFEDFRITVVWEVRGGITMSPSGIHGVFLTGDATPRPLTVPVSTAHNDVAAPVTVIYDSKQAALYYQCPNPEAVRKSISMDFHLNPITDDVQLLSTQTHEPNLEKLTLTKLVTEFPIAAYAAHFHRLLFNTDSLNMILTKLFDFGVPPPTAVPDHTKRLRGERFEAYRNENLAHIPPTIRSMETDVPLAGTYNSPADFLNSIYVKARREVHLPIGMDLVPQNSMDANRESARKFIRDLPEDVASKRLGQYAQVLTHSSYIASDLLSTTHLHKLAKLMERGCLELIAHGFVDSSSLLHPIAALASAFGDAINGLKEVEVIPEPWIEIGDLQVYRTRCLYLFWCADWLRLYLIQPTEGPFMVMDVNKAKEALSMMKRDMDRAAKLLLRNWVAWDLFMGGRPQGGFHVRRSASGVRQS